MRIFKKVYGYSSTLSTSIRATTLGLSGKATTLITSLKPVYLTEVWLGTCDLNQRFSLDRDLVEERAILDGVHIQMELLVLPAIAHKVALVGGDHDVLEFLVL